MFPLPKVVVSKCLGFDRCRYNGEVINDDFVDSLKPFVTITTVCPEIEIGLGVPRHPIRIAEIEGKRQLYQPASERFVTGEMEKFVDTFCDLLGDVDGFILKNRSPSCGLSDVKIYSGLDNAAPVTRGSGFFGGEVLKRYSHLASEDEGRLRNFSIREHFLTKLFTLARFRAVKEAGTINALIEFQSTHKLLLLAYNQSRFRTCGRIVANHEKLAIGTVFDRYEEELKLLLAAMPKYTSMINTLQHAFGWISEELSRQERAYFLNTIEEYRDERIPLGTLLHLLSSYAVRFNRAYLLNQVILNPYPRELLLITDSGKGRNL